MPETTQYYSSQNASRINECTCSAELMSVGDSHNLLFFLLQNSKVHPMGWSVQSNGIHSYIVSWNGVTDFH